MKVSFINVLKLVSCLKLQIYSEATDFGFAFTAIICVADKIILNNLSQFDTGMKENVDWYFRVLQKEQAQPDGDAPCMSKPLGILIQNPCW